MAMIRETMHATPRSLLLGGLAGTLVGAVCFGLFIGFEALIGLFGPARAEFAANAAWRSAVISLPAWALLMAGFAAPVFALLRRAGLAGWLTLPALSVAALSAGGAALFSLAGEGLGGLPGLSLIGAPVLMAAPVAVGAMRLVARRPPPPEAAVAAAEEELFR